MILGLDNKIALITGASYGIGFAIAQGFASVGATIVFNDINKNLYKGQDTVGIKAGFVCDVKEIRRGF